MRFISEETQSSAKMCNCKIPCITSTYTPTISFADISSDSIEVLLQRGGRKKLLRSSYHRTLDTRQRVHSDIFMKQMKLMIKVQQTYTSFYKELQIEIDSNTSLNAVRFITKMFKEDLTSVSKVIDSVKFFHSKILSPFENALKYSMNETCQRILELLICYADLFSSREEIKHIQLNNTITSLINSMKSSIVTLRVYRQEILSPPLNLSSTFFPPCDECFKVIPYATVRPMKKERACMDKVDNFIETLKFTSNLLHLIQGNFNEYVYKWKDGLSKYIHSIYSEVNNVTDWCIHDFATSLHNTDDWKQPFEEVQQDFQKLLEPFNITEKSVIFLRNKAFLQHIYVNYSNAQLNISHLRVIFNQSLVNNQITDADYLLSAFQDFVDSRIAATKHLRDKIQQAYKSLLKRAATIEAYYNESMLEENAGIDWRMTARNMSIWKGFVANMDNPSAPKETEENVIFLWREIWSIKEFLEEHDGLYKLDGTVDEYFRPILSGFENGDSDLRKMMENIKTDLRELLEEVDKISKEMQMDDPFIK